MAALKAYRPDIDGMRAIAVLSVVAFHYGLPVPGGFVGVDVFFVISGYLIGSLIYREACEGTFSYRTFYTRRARRILPALLAVLVATFAAMLLVATPLELQDFGGTAVATVLSTSNIYLWHSIDYFRPGADLNPLLMTWSLGVEEQFYLLAPVFLLLLPRLPVRWRWAVLGGLVAASLGLAVWGVRNEPQATFYMLPTRAWELAAGVLLGVLDIHGARSGAPDRAGSPTLELRALCGLALVVAPAFLYDTTTPFPGAAAVPPVLGTVLLLGTPGSLVNRRLLALPTMRFFGLISYSLYLWHWPLVSLTRLVLEQEPSVMLRAVLLTLSFALAWASYRFIELPFRRARSPARTSLWRYAAAMALVALLTGSAVLRHGYPERWTPSFVATAAEVGDAEDRCLALFETAAPLTSAHCYPPRDTHRLVALVGDSHAAALAPGIRALASRDGLGLAQLTKASCPFLVGVSREASEHPHLLRDCALFDRRVMQILLHDERIGTVIIAGFWRVGSMRESSYVATDGSDLPSEVLLERGLSAAVSMLQQGGKRVVIVRDVPFIDFLPQKRLAACASRLRAALNGLGKERCGFATRHEIASDAPAKAVLAAVAHATGAMLVDPRSVLCDGGRCRIAERGHLLYRDQQHLSPAGSALASVAFASVLARSAGAASRSRASSP